VIWATNGQQNVLNKGYFSTNKGIKYSCLYKAKDKDLAQKKPPI